MISQTNSSPAYALYAGLLYVIAYSAISMPSASQALRASS